MRRTLTAILTTLLTAGVWAQQSPPAFEVASVRQNTSGDGREFIRMLPGNRLNATNFPARLLIALAYQLQQFQLVGGPAWLANDRFDIVAKLAGEQQPFVPGQPNPAMLAMRALLAERFTLKLHQETRDLDVYNLVMLKPGMPGPALKPSTTDCAAEANARRRAAPPVTPPGPPGPNDPLTCGLMGVPGLVRLGGLPIAQITQMLTAQTGRLVIDRTNLAGNWDFTLRFAAEQRGQPPAGANLPPPDPDAPSIFTAIQEQLGLKLESAKAPVQVTVIDSAEHPSDD